LNIHKFLFIAGSKLRNPSLWKHYSDLKSSERWSLEKLKFLQQSRLLQFLEHAAINSEYYNLLFRSLGWTPGEKVTMDLFRKIPVLTKSVLLYENEKLHSKENSEKLFFCETSGTSGQVLTFRRNESWDSFNRATIMRGYSWHGAKPWDFNLYFWGYDLSFAKKLKLRIRDFLVHRYRMFDYSKKTMKNLVNKIGKAVYIEGYSSMIYELACISEGKPINTSNLKMIKGTSEKIYPHYREKTKAVFGKNMISEYGAAETGIIAFECVEGNMHINLEGVYVETNSENEIIVTNFHSYSFPVIRYMLGDVVQMKDQIGICKCGVAHPVIEEVTGRVGKLIYGKKHQYPSLTFYYIFKNLYFEKNLHLNYQAHQNQIGHLEIRIKETFNKEVEQLIYAECRKYFGEDILVNLIQSSDFRTPGGKLRDFITTIN